MSFYIMKRLNELKGGERIGFVLAVAYFLIISFLIIHALSNSSLNFGDCLFYYIAIILIWWFLPIFLILLFIRKLLPWIKQGFTKSDEKK